MTENKNSNPKPAPKRVNKNSNPKPAPKRVLVKDVNENLNKYIAKQDKHNEKVDNYITNDAKNSWIKPTLYAIGGAIAGVALVCGVPKVINYFTSDKNVDTTEVVAPNSYDNSINIGHNVSTSPNSRNVVVATLYANPDKNYSINDTSVVSGSEGSNNSRILTAGVDSAKTADFTKELEAILKQN